MGVCPKCSREVTDEFGLIVCDGCGTTLFVDLDGTPAMQESEEGHSFDEVSYREDSVNDAGEEVEAFEENDQNLKYEELVPPSKYVEEAQPEAEEYVTSTNVRAQELEEAKSEKVEDNYFDFDEDTDSNPLKEEPKKPEYNLEDMSEIADYGNSEVSQGRDGTLLFTIKISGIDSKDLREELGYALEDARFLWDSLEILKSIKMGSLIIEDMSAIKAAVLLQRLRGTSLEIGWEQNAIFES